MRVENFFLRYAYPCAYIIVQRGEINSSELKELERAAISEEGVSRERLEKIFHMAFEFIDELAKKMGKDRWDISVIKEYFYSYHNEVIEKGVGVYGNAPKMLKELSKVEKGVVKGKKDDVLTVEYNGKRRDVLNSFVPSAKIGDIITIHYGYAIEIVGSD